MKKTGMLVKMRCVLCMIMAVIMSLMAFTVVVGADELPEIKVTLNGEYITFDVPPMMLENRTMVPVRAIFEALGADVLWDGETRTATGKRGNITVNITVDSNVMFKNGTPIQLDVPARIINNRTLIPARAVSEALECKVDWDGVTRTVIITSQKVEMNAEQISEKISPAVFYIENYDANGYKISSGSGFFIDEKGTAVTNYHVVSESYSAKITTSDGRKFAVEKTYLLDSENDIAILGISQSDSENEPADSFEFVELKTDAGVKSGEKVFALGSPLGLKNSISEGIVSNPERTMDGESGTYIQTTAPISSGSSGGVLVNAYGEAVGITTASLTTGQNLNLAIPVIAVKDVFTSFGEGKEFLQASIDEYVGRVKDADKPLSPIRTTPASSGNVLEVTTHAESFTGSIRTYGQTDYYLFTIPCDLYVNAVVYANTVGMSDKDIAVLLESSTTMMLMPINFDLSGETKEDGEDEGNGEDEDMDIGAVMQEISKGNSRILSEEEAAAAEQAGMNVVRIEPNFSEFRVDDSGMVVSTIEETKLKAGTYVYIVRSILPQQLFVPNYTYTTYLMFTAEEDFKSTFDEPKGYYENTKISDFGKFYDVEPVGSTPYEKVYSAESFEQAEKFDIAVGNYTDSLIKDGFRLSRYTIDSNDNKVYTFTNEPVESDTEENDETEDKKEVSAESDEKYYTLECFYHEEENGINILL